MNGAGHRPVLHRLTLGISVVFSHPTGGDTMSKRSKKSYSAKLKFQVVLEALTSDKGDAEVARAYDVHPVSLSKWKRQFIDSGAEIFSGNDTVKTYESRLSELERLLGQKEVELALLKIFLGNR